MKKLILIIVIGFQIQSAICQTLEPIRPLSTPYNLEKVQFINDTIGYAASWDYSFFKTQDGGITWSQSYLNNLWSNPIEDMLFINDSIGYVATFQKVYRTNNFGDSWHEIVDVDNVKTLNYVSDSILVLSNWKNIYRSLDNGHTWIDTTNFSDVVGHSGFYKNTGYALCYNKEVYRTLDAGENWNLIDTLDIGYFTAIEVVNDSLVFIAGSDKKIYSSADSGNTWTAYGLDPVNSVVDIKFINCDTGFAVTTCQNLGSGIYKTINGGKTWYATNHPVSAYYQGLKAISFSNDSLGFVVGNFGTVLKSDDYGENWTSLFDEERHAIYASYLLDSTTLFTGGHSGSIMKSEDLGKTWKHKTTDTDLSIRDIVFVTDSIGFAVGGGSYYFSQVTNGFLIKTIDRGENWNSVTLPFSEGLFKVIHLGGDTVMVTGVKGKVYISPNLGISWTEQNTQTDYNIIDAHKISNDTIFLVGDKYMGSGGLILKTTNKGTNWNTVYTDVDSDFKSITMTSSRKGYVVGHYTGGWQTLILETNTGGESWVEKTFPISTSGLSNVTFFGENFGIAHSNTAIIISKDGGVTWNNPFLYCEMPENSIMNAILVNDTLGYIFTTGGGVFRFTSHPTLNCDKVLGVDTVFACDSYTWIDGNTYTTDNNTATYNLPNGAFSGCDSLAFLELTILKSSSITDVITACDSHTWIDGETYTESNYTATHILTNVQGCDSIISLNLTIKSLANEVEQTNNSLTASATDATYNWFDCNGDPTEILAQSQTFIADTTGQYAVQISKDGCIATSECYDVVIQSTNINSTGVDYFKIYPNPTAGRIILDFKREAAKAEVIVRDITGQTLDYYEFFNSTTTEFEIIGKPGIYIIEVIAESLNIKPTFIRIIKN